MKCCFIIDPISDLHIEKDTTFALLLEAAYRGWEIYTLEIPDLCLRDNTVYGCCQRIAVKDVRPDYYKALNKPELVALNVFDIVWIRKDPPFDEGYLFATYLLELAQQQGAQVINSPRSIRDVNEKLYTAWFSACTPETLVCADNNEILTFLHHHKKIIVKPLNAMGGKGIFLLEENAHNVHVTLEILTYQGSVPIMAQRYIPEISLGDKRILMINGEPYPYALLRVPKRGEHRANLAAQGTGIAYRLTQRDHWICQQIGPTLREKNLFFVGLDVIGDYLTEINVTSPTCVREITRLFDVNVCADILDILVAYLEGKRA